MIQKVRPLDIRSTLDKINEYTYKSWFFSSSLIPTYIGYKAAKELGDTVLTGDGADEIFYGYDRYLVWQKMRKLPIGFRNRAAEQLPKGKTRKWRSTFPSFAKTSLRMSPRPRHGRPPSTLPTMILKKRSKQVVY